MPRIVTPLYKIVTPTSTLLTDRVVFVDVTHDTSKPTAKRLEAATLLEIEPPYVATYRERVLTLHIDTVEYALAQHQLHVDQEGRQCHAQFLSNRIRLGQTESENGKVFFVPAKTLLEFPHEEDYYCDHMSPLLELRSLLWGMKQLKLKTVSLYAAIEEPSVILSTLDKRLGITVRQLK